MPSRRTDGESASRLSAINFQSASERAAPYSLGDDSADFDDALHACITTARPKTEDECTEYLGKVGRLVRAAGEDAEHWKTLCLALVRRRYHSRAPAWRLEEATVADKEVDSAGDGERLLFYLAVRAMQAASLEGHRIAGLAAAALCRMAPMAGGTRDVCTLIEHLAFQMLSTMRSSGEPFAPLPDGKVLPVLVETLGTCFGPAESALESAHAPLFALLDAAARLLDEDVTLVRAAAEATQRASEKSGKPRAEDGALMSTISTFLPHNDRGASGSCRRLVQCLVELLIWARTTAATDNPAFATALGLLKAELAARGDGGKASVEGLIHRLQTHIRRLRKELNASARQQGFALCTLYSLDPAAVSLRALRRGKAGDLSMLKKLATKAGDTRVLSLFAKRNIDEGKATPYESIGHMMREWKPLDLRQPPAECDELVSLDRALQRAAVAATLDKLRRRLPRLSGDAERRAVTMTVACLDGGAINQAAAVLVAAAMQPEGTMRPVAAEVAAAEAEAAAIAAAEAAEAALSTAVATLEGAPEKEVCPDTDVEATTPPVSKRPKSVASDGSTEVAPTPTHPPVLLLLGEREVDVSSFTRVLALLDAIFAAGGVAASPDVPATTKAVQNLIERRVGPREALLLFTSTDVKLEQRVLAQLQAQESMVHAHINDEVLARMEREGAKVGDVTVTLAWDDYNDLDLHVFTPSGEHISYQSTEADGGKLDVDMNAGGRMSKEPVENVFFGDAERGVEARRGRYRVVVQNYAYHEKERDVPVPFRVLVRMNGEVTEYHGQTPAGETGTASEVDICRFEYHGRKVAVAGSGPSAMEASNLVAVTASVGSTLDALGGLMGLGAELAELERTRALVQEAEDLEAPLPGSTEVPLASPMEMEADDEAAVEEDEADAEAEALEADALAMAASAVVAEAPAEAVGAEVTVASRGAELPAGRQPLTAARGRFEVTSRDRLLLQLAKLPERFHDEVRGAFGGASLLELTASQLAARLLTSNTSASVLRSQGYPDHIVHLVKRAMAMHGRSGA